MTGETSRRNRLLKKIISDVFKKIGTNENYKEGNRKKNVSGMRQHG